MSNRTIKFRAWDKANSKVVTQEYLDCHRSGFRLLESEDFAFMQFTGLFDVKGAEVYEGDVVRVWNVNEMEDIDNLEEREELNTERGHLCDQVVKWTTSGYFCEEEGGHGYCPPLGAADEIAMEVIGNIWENPELLGV